MSLVLSVSAHSSVVEFILWRVRAFTQRCLCMLDVAWTQFKDGIVLCQILWRWYNSGLPFTLDKVSVINFQPSGTSVQGIKTVIRSVALVSAPARQHRIVWPWWTPDLPLSFRRKNAVNDRWSWDRQSKRTVSPYRWCGDKIIHTTQLVIFDFAQFEQLYWWADWVNSATTVTR